jgi:hypothetical protein
MGKRLSSASRLAMVGKLPVEGEVFPFAGSEIDLDGVNRRYRDQYCVYNDDVQGTAGITTPPPGRSVGTGSSATTGQPYGRQRSWPLVPRQGQGPLCGAFQCLLQIARASDVD